LLRGFIIQYSSHKKFNAAKLADLERGIKCIEAKSKRSISESILKELTHFKYEYNIIISPPKKPDYLLFRARQTFFESVDKAGKYLARYIKQKESKSSVAAVMTADGSLANK